jgi:peptide/nickel transport system permease protein
VEGFASGGGGAPVIWRILLRRGGQAMGVALLVSTLSFLMVRALPGDLAMRIAAGRYGFDLVGNAAAEEVRRELKLDQPLASALAEWWFDVAKLNLGLSSVSRRPVVEEAWHHLTHSAGLALAAMFLALLIGPLTGYLCALWRGGWLDRTTQVGAAILRGIPSFVLGLAFIIVFSVQLSALPAAGTSESSSIFLPALTLAAGLAASLCRVSRTAFADVLDSAYYLFARTKGLSLRQALRWHVLRNAAVPIIAYTGVQLAFLIEGIIAVETLFAWPGIGHALVHAIFARDIPMIQGSVLMMAMLFIALSAAVDLTVAAVDPRNR